MDYSNAIPSANGKPPSGLAGFDNAEPAPEYTPLPAGIYVGRVQRGEYCSTKAGAEAYRMRFEITEGPHAGKTVVRTWTFTERALSFTKRDLLMFGLGTMERLLSPFPPAGKEVQVRLIVALQRGDDGREFNDIKRIDVLRVVVSAAGEFLLPETTEGGQQ